MDSSPYTPPNAVEAPTSQQLMYARTMLAFRRNPSGFRLFAAHWRPILLAHIFVVGIALLPSLLGLHPSLLWVSVSAAVGLSIGYNSSLFGLCMARRRVWPVVELTTDWEAIERLATVGDCLPPTQTGE